MKRKATAVWKGSGKEGTGHVSTQSSILNKVQYSFSSRFAEGTGTNPEELLGASLAGCYAMALNATLEKEGKPAKSVRTEAKVFLGKDDSGFKINRIDLFADAEVAGIEDAEFQAIAEKVSKACPISRALAATEINLSATLTKAQTAG